MELPSVEVLEHLPQRVGVDGTTAVGSLCDVKNVTRRQALLVQLPDN